MGGGPPFAFGLFGLSVDNHAHELLQHTSSAPATHVISSCNTRPPTHVRVQTPTRTHSHTHIHTHTQQGKADKGRERERLPPAPAASTLIEPSNSESLTRALSDSKPKQTKQRMPESL